jgi:hypothetical protein
MIRKAIRTPVFALIGACYVIWNHRKLPTAGTPVSTKAWPDGVEPPSHASPTPIPDPASWPPSGAHAGHTGTHFPGTRSIPTEEPYAAAVVDVVPLPPPAELELGGRWLAPDAWASSF